MNALGLLGNWFWQVGLVACRFYCLKASPKGSSLEMLHTFSKKKKFALHNHIISLVEKHLAKTNIPYYLIKTFHLTPYKLSHKMNELEIKKHQKASLFFCVINN